MKIFIYKTLFVFICLFFLFNLTIGYQVRKIENSIENISSKEKIGSLKIKLKKEINSSLKKDNIFKEEDRILIKNFLNKIILELELNN
jgi:hypothetical protein|tara:strand:- start:116 stop:379 length:264 start_codon:yes stop_codon:yes gene_type:complete